MPLLGHKPKKDEVLDHWIAFADAFSLAPQEFYAAVEREMVARKIPSLEVSRVEYAEGGFLSEQRLYLRMLRERLAFDMCAAPFGRSFFFSCRTVYSPPVVRLWHLLAVTGALVLLTRGLFALLGGWFTAIALLGLVLALAEMFRNVVSLGLADLDAALLKIPALGPIYERWIRAETYYRQDTRLVYLKLVPDIIKMLADEFVGTKGIQLVAHERAPVFGELYKPVPPKKP